MQQKITLPEHIKVEIWEGHWTRQDAIDNPDKLFLFGGNVLQDHFQKSRVAIPSSTQAVIRGLKNAIPINTKWSNGKLDSAYFNDDDIWQVKAQLNVLESYLRKLFADGYTTVIIPSKENGIGTGTAFLKEKAPKCWEILQEFLNPLYERAEQKGA